MKLYLNGKLILDNITYYNFDKKYLEVRSKYERNYVDIINTIEVYTSDIDKLTFKDKTINITSVDNIKVLYRTEKIPTIYSDATLEEVEGMLYELSNGNFIISSYTDGNSPASVKCVSCDNEINFKKGNTIYSRSHLETYRSDRYYTCSKCSFINIRGELIKFLKSYNNNINIMINNIKHIKEGSRINIQDFICGTNLNELSLPSSFFDIKEIMIESVVHCRFTHRKDDGYACNIKSKYSEPIMHHKLKQYIEYYNTCFEKYNLKEVSIKDFIK